MTMNTVTNYCEGVKYENPDKFAHTWQFSYRNEFHEWQRPLIEGIKF